MRWGYTSASIVDHAVPGQNRIVPHARTLRNAREQVKQMVASGVSPRRIMRYLQSWLTWWVNTAVCWTQYELLTWFLDACWDTSARNVGMMLLSKCRSIATADMRHAALNLGLV